MGPLRDTFYLSLSGDALNLMDDKLDSCFNPSKLQFFVHNEIVDTGYKVLSHGFSFYIQFYESDGTSALGKN